MTYKAIISDVDGTLVQQGSIFNKHGLPTQKIAEAIFRIQDRIHFGIATSRPFEAIAYLLDHLSLTGPSILFGGSRIVDGKNNKILWEKTIDPLAAGEVLRIIKKYHIDYNLHEIDGKEIINNPMYTPTAPLNIFLAELDEQKFPLIHEELKKISDIAIHRTPSWNTHLWAFDITHAEATKQHGVVKVAEILNISPSEIIGIGDGYNDFPLLMACGLRVAMGNAVDELKAIADYIAPSVNNDGLADVIEKYILEP